MPRLRTSEMRSIFQLKLQAISTPILSSLYDFLLFELNADVVALVMDYYLPIPVSRHILSRADLLEFLAVELHQFNLAQDPIRVISLYSQLQYTPECDPKDHDHTYLSYYENYPFDVSDEEYYSDEQEEEEEWEDEVDNEAE